jgi:tRNA nucleotidyltransferase (CCA-adding enzyme)
MPAIAVLLETMGRDYDQSVYLVGGCVRDLLMDREPLDLDLAVEGSLGQLLQRLEGTPELHDRFGTATVTRNGSRYDIAQTRVERYPAPGALPEVRAASITEDLARRDFTVNAIALALTGPRADELLTVDGALDDLAAGRIEVLHDRSFTDDPTRLLRMVRYAARLDFQISPHTRQLADSAVVTGALETVSGARAGNELRLLAVEADPIAAFSELSEVGLDHAIDSALSFNPERQALARRALEQLPSDGRPEILVLGVALLGANAKPAALLLDRLEFTAADRDAILEVAGVNRLTQALASAESGSAIARAVGSAGVATVALAAAQGPLLQAQRWLTTLRNQTLQISGDDLIQAGIAQGPELGKRLAAARDAMWDGIARDRESQLEIAVA